MKQLLSSIFILLFFNSLLFSQPAKTILKGRVIDQEKNEGIAFVSIGIEGTSTGAASNPEGYFELQIPEEHKTKSLFFSAIGYKNNSFAIPDLLQNQNISIPLVPQSYDIETVDVAAESKVLQRILRTAFERIPQNYISGPVNLKLFYDRKKSINELRFTEKSIVDLYDKNGYNQPSWADAFKNRSYQIIESQTSVSPNSFREASNDIDELLELDLVRLSNTIMNPNLFSGFDLRMEAKPKFEGDSVWIISYVAKKLDLAHTGSFYPTSFDGKIYISQTNYTVLRSEIHLADAKANQQGRSLAVKTNPVTKIQMNITTGYKKVQGKYVLSFIDSEKQYTSGDNQSVFESGKLIVLEVETKLTRPISGRNYFAKTELNETFWQNFHLPSK
ncbi:MAG: carboxypeptidase-like regulatory domain-containing protein [Bacteroidota bacterium]|nr:carboxypeptidase-like regulatory domain-containing protein [Bacteroidota bacterium]MDO9613326.1 carboxypeptidase-like regulatory domain-containing protein [Bacteroidota bacterium]